MRPQATSRTDNWNRRLRVEMSEASKGEGSMKHGGKRKPAKD